MSTATASPHRDGPDGSVPEADLPTSAVLRDVGVELEAHGLAVLAGQRDRAGQLLALVGLRDLLPSYRELCGAAPYYWMFSATFDSAQAIADSREIRAVALNDKIPYYTTAAGSIAAVAAIRSRGEGEVGVRALQA